MTTLTKEPIEVEPARLKWTRERYYAAVDANVIGEDEKVELIGGEIVTEGMADRMTQKAIHYWVLHRIEEILKAAFPTGFTIRTQAPLSLLEDSDPEPDVAVVAGGPDDYREDHPKTAALIVEVSDASLRFDQTYKASLYASAGIADYWIVNVAQRVIEVHREPLADDDRPFGFRYASITQHGPTESISPLASPSSSISVGELLP